MPDNREILIDLSRNLQRDLGGMLHRHTRLAGTVLTTAEVAEMLIEASVMVLATSIASVSNHATDDASIEAVFDMTLTAIVNAVGSVRPKALAKVREERAKNPA